MTEERRSDLPNKPLVEVIVEIKWGQEKQIDTITAGRLYEKVREEYPVIEDLPITQIPIEPPHMVRHRFRRERGGSCSTQLGADALPVAAIDGDHRWQFNWYLSN